jgi:hypothetical protein
LEATGKGQVVFHAKATVDMEAGPLYVQLLGIELIGIDGLLKDRSGSRGPVLNPGMK